MLENGKREENAQGTIGIISPKVNKRIKHIDTRESVTFFDGFL